MLGDRGRVSDVERHDMATVGKVSASAKEKDLAPVVGDAGVALGDVLVDLLRRIVRGGGCGTCGRRELTDVHAGLHEFTLMMAQTHIVAGQQL